MEMSYLKLFLDWKQKTKNLKPEEKGRLIDALIDYASGNDAEDTLTGNEIYIYPVFQLQIDRDREELEKYSKKQSENGAKGGRPRKATETQENPKNPPLFSETQENPEKLRLKNKIKEEEKEKEDIFIGFANGDQGLLDTLRDFEKMRKQIKAPLTDQAKKMLCSRLSQLATDNPTRIEILNQSILNSWKGVFPLKGNTVKGNPKAPLTGYQVGNEELRMLQRLEVIG